MAKEKKKVLHMVEAMGGGVFTFIVELANGLRSCPQYIEKLIVEKILQGK